jgi:hypothetical protein
MTGSRRQRLTAHRQLGPDWFTLAFENLHYAETSLHLIDASGSLTVTDNLSRRLGARVSQFTLIVMC